MERSRRRTAALVAALPVLALASSGAGVAAGPPTVTGADRGSTATAGPGPLVERQAPVAPLAPDRTSPRLPAPPRSSVDCFPIGRVEPARPGTFVLPGVEPRVPGPVPLPELATSCDSDLLVPGGPVDPGVRAP